MRRQTDSLEREQQNLSGNWCWVTKTTAGHAYYDVQIDLSSEVWPLWYVLSNKMVSSEHRVFVSSLAG
ncbi:Nuclease SbcCD subunit C [Clarias magur]|uniref:Nuclease SbcCD subunit C n=1 Tax=Clarias magur TaxID=1594786 RepID=A0A8J4XAQ3_CLAMG|nr:Nuclease SbcCD subunit C [Clarias magur]